MTPTQIAIKFSWDFQSFFVGLNWTHEHEEGFCEDCGVDHQFRSTYLTIGLIPVLLIVQIRFRTKTSTPHTE